LQHRASSKSGDARAFRLVRLRKSLSRASSSSGSVAWLIEYVVHPPALAPQLVAHLRGQGYDATNYGQRLWVTHPHAADPTEERLVLGAVITAWRREHPDARIDLHPTESNESGLSF
jgi:hypothetical protein